MRGNKKACNCWYVRQDILADDAKAANAKALDILKRGVDSLGFKIPGDCVRAEFVATLLDGIDCEAVEVNFNTCKRHTVELASILAAYFDGKGYDKSKSLRLVGLGPDGENRHEGHDVTPILAFAPQIVRP